MLFLYCAALEVDAGAQRPHAALTLLHLDLLSSFTALAPALAPALAAAPVETRQASGSLVRPIPAPPCSSPSLALQPSAALLV